MAYGFDALDAAIDTYKSDDEAKKEVSKRSTELQGKKPEGSGAWGALDAAIESAPKSAPAEEVPVKEKSNSSWGALDAAIGEIAPQEKAANTSPVVRNVDPDSPDVPRGFSTSMVGDLEALYGIGGLAANMVGADKVSQWAFDKAAALRAEGAAEAKESDAFIKGGKWNLKDFDSVADFTQFWTGYLGAEAVKAIGAAYVGSKVGGAWGAGVGFTASAANTATQIVMKKSLLKLLREKMDEQILQRTLTGNVSKELATREAEKQFGKEVGKNVGQTVALAAYNIGRETGGIYNEKREGKGGKELDALEIAKVIATGTAAGLLEGYMDKLNLDLAKGALAAKTGKITLMERAKYGLAEGFKAGVREALTEGAQTVLERVGADKSLTDVDAFDDIVNSMVVGAFGGHMLGGGAALIKGRGSEPKVTPTKEPEAAETPEQAAVGAETAPMAGRMEKGEFERLVRTPESDENTTGLSVIAAIRKNATEEQRKEIDNFAARNDVLERVLELEKNTEALMKGDEEIAKDPEFVDRFLGSVPAYNRGKLPVEGFYETKEEKLRAAQEIERQMQESPDTEAAMEELVKEGKADPGDALLWDLGIDPNLYDAKKAEEKAAPQGEQGTPIAGEIQPRPEGIPDTVPSVAPRPGETLADTKKKDAEAIAAGLEHLASKAPDLPEVPAVTKVKDYAAVEQKIRQDQFAVRPAVRWSMEAKLAGLFGARVFTYHGVEKTSGFTIPEQRAIFLNRNIKNQAMRLFVLGHEIFHQIEMSDPKAAALLRRELFKYLNSNKSAALKAYRKSFGSERTVAASELSADLMGRAFMDQAFWNQVAQTGPEGVTVVQKVWALVGALLDKISRFINGTAREVGDSVSDRAGYAQWVLAGADLKKVHTALAGALMKYRQQAEKAGTGQVREMSDVKYEWKQDEKGHWYSTYQGWELRNAAGELLAPSMRELGDLKQLEEQYIRKPAEEEETKNLPVVKRTEKQAAWDEAQAARRAKETAVQKKRKFTKREQTESVNIPPIPEGTEVYVGGVKPKEGGMDPIKKALSSLLPKGAKVLTDAYSPIGAMATIYSKGANVEHTNVGKAAPSGTTILFHSGRSKDLAEFNATRKEALANGHPVYVVNPDGTVAYYAPTVAEATPPPTRQRELLTEGLAPEQKKALKDLDAEVAKWISEGGKWGTIKRISTYLKTQDAAINDLYAKAKEGDFRITDTDFIGEQVDEALRDMGLGEGSPGSEEALSAAQGLKEEVHRIMGRNLERRAAGVLARAKLNLWYLTHDAMDQMRAAGIPEDLAWAKTTEYIRQLETYLKAEPTLDQTVEEEVAPTEGPIAEQLSVLGRHEDQVGAVVALVQDYKNKTMRHADLVAAVQMGLQKGDFTHRALVQGMRRAGIAIDKDTIGLMTQPFMQKTYAEWSALHQNDMFRRNEWLSSLYRFLRFTEKGLEDIKGIILHRLRTEDPAGEAAFARYEQEADALRGRMKQRKDIIRDDDGRVVGTRIFDNIEDAFPHALFNRYSLEQVRDPMKIKDPALRNALTTEFTDPEAAWWSDVGRALQSRPDLTGDLMKAMTPEERRLTHQRLKVRAAELARDSAVAANREAFSKLYEFRYLAPQVYNLYARSLAVSQQHEQAAILQSAEEASRTVEMALEQGVDPVTALTQQVREKLDADGLSSVPIDEIREDIARLEAVGFAAADIREAQARGRRRLAEEEVSKSAYEEEIEDTNAADPEKLTELAQQRDTSRLSFRRARVGDSNSPVAVAEDVIARVEEIKLQNPNLPKINVVQSLADLPDALFKQAEQKLGGNFDAKALFDAETGQIYLFSGAITDTADVEFSIFHEVYGHYGLRGLMGTGLDAFLERMYKTNQKVRDLVNREYSDLPHLEAIEEAISDLGAGTAIRQKERFETRRRMLATGVASITPIPKYIGNLLNTQKKLLDIINNYWFAGYSFDYALFGTDQFVDLMKESGLDATVDEAKKARELYDSISSHVQKFVDPISKSSLRVPSIVGQESWWRTFLTEGKRLSPEETENLSENEHEDYLNSPSEFFHYREVDLVQSYIRDPLGFADRAASLYKEMLQESGVESQTGQQQPKTNLQSVRDLGPFKMMMAEAVRWMRSHGWDSVANWMDKTGELELAAVLRASRKAVNEGRIGPINGAPGVLTHRMSIYEMYATKDGKTVGYARYNPVAGTWVVYESTGAHIAQNYTYTLVADAKDARRILHQIQGAKVGERRRSPYYRGQGTARAVTDIPDMTPETTKGRLWRDGLKKLQNEYLPVLEVIRYLSSQGISTGNLWNNLLLYNGRLKNILDSSQERYIDPIMEAVKAIGEKGGTSKDIDQYLIARHAEERNKAISNINPNKLDGSGMTTQDANNYLRNTLPNLPYAAELDAIGQKIDAMGREKLEYLHRTGMITTATMNTLLDTYEHYVTLSGQQGEDLDTDPISKTIGRKFNVRSKDLKRALGRFDMAENVLARTLVNYESAMIRGQKNKIAQSVMELVEAAKAGSFAVVSPVSYVQDLDKATNTVKLIEDPNLIKDPNVMVVKVDGKTYLIKFNDHTGQEFVKALHGPVVPDEGGIAEVIGRWNMLTSQLITTYNPAWAVINSMRDVQTAFFNAAATEGAGVKLAAKMVKMMGRTMYTSYLHHTRNWLPSPSDKPVIKQFKQMLANRRAKLDPQLVQYYKDWEAEGGKTAFMDRKGLDQFARNFESLLSGKTATPQRIKNWLDGFADHWAIPSEEGPRLAAYVVMRQAGWSSERAAVFAKELTVNFNMKGSARGVRQMYMFFNPAIQGSERLLRGFNKNATKREKIAAITTAGNLIALGMITNVISRMFGSDDDDPVDKLDTVPAYKRATSIVLFPGIPFGAPVPLAYGWNAFYATGTFLMDMVWHGFNKDVVKSSTARIAQSALDAFMPNAGNVDFGGKMRGEDWLRVFSPTPLVPAMDLGFNRNRWGGPISKDESAFIDYKTSNAYSHFANVNPISEYLTKGLLAMTLGNKFNTGIAPSLADWNPGKIDYAISSYLPGFISEGYKGAGALIKWARGDESARMNIPVVDRFTAKVPESFAQGAVRRLSEDVATKYKELQYYPSKEARILNENPNLGGIKDVTDKVKQKVRDIRNKMNRVEASQLPAAEKIKLRNELRKEERELYNIAMREAIKGGYLSEVISGD